MNVALCSWNKWQSVGLILGRKRIPALTNTNPPPCPPPLGLTTSLLTSPSQPPPTTSHLSRHTQSSRRQNLLQYKNPSLHLILYGFFFFFKSNIWTSWFWLPVVSQPLLQLPVQTNSTGQHSLSVCDSVYQTSMMFIDGSYRTEVTVFTQPSQQTFSPSQNRQHSCISRFTCQPQLSQSKKYFVTQ